MNKIKILCLIIAISFLIAGCNPHHPQKISLPSPLPKKFLLSSKTGPSFFPKKPWWETFKDPHLNKLIKQALAHNLEIKAAIYRLFQSRAALKQATSAYLPWISLNYTLRRSKEPGVFGNNEGTSYSLSATASYELDLWKKISSLKKAAQAEEQATKEELYAVYLSVAAQTADAYYLYLALKGEEKILKEWIQTLEEEKSLIKDQYYHGLSSAEDLLNLQQKISQIQKRQQDLKESLAKTLYALAVLLGHYPENLPQIPIKPLPKIQKVFPQGIPSEILAYRPDVQAAYWKVKSIDARLAATVAEFFPHFNLMADIGRSSTAYSLGDIVGSFWGLTFQSVWDLFQGGLKKAQLEQEKALWKETLTQYQKTVIMALQDVEVSLQRDLSCQKRLYWAQEEEQQARTLYNFSLEEYRQGISPYLKVLQYKERLLEAKLLSLQEQQALISSRISLYRALGGRWMEKFLDQEIRGSHGT